MIIIPLLMRPLKKFYLFWLQPLNLWRMHPHDELHFIITNLLSIGLAGATGLLGFMFEAHSHPPHGHAEHGEKLKKQLIETPARPPAVSEDSAKAPSASEKKK